jgi:SAM-dependent methyltransferase
MTDPSPSVDEQRRFWNDWNAAYPERKLDRPSVARGEAALARLRALGLPAPRILEVGCGFGWLSERLAEVGPTTAIDLADEVLQRSRQRWPHVRFLAGDVMTADLEPGAFDVIVTLETFSHVDDQAAFCERLARLLAPRGYLILTTQNRFVFTRRTDVMPLRPGQIRRWVDRRGLRRLLAPRFEVLSLTSLVPAGHGGVLRIVNSTRLNAALGRLVGDSRLERLKERAGLGQTLIATARRRD